jgi:dihydroorotase
LILSDDLARGYNSLYKVNPPLRTEADIRAVREGLVDGTIDIIATDHAPHQSEAKECEWAAAAFGMTGLEVAASVAQEVLIESGSSTWARLAEVLSINPAKIAGDNEHGQDLSVGSIANLVVIDPSAKRVISATSESKSRNNPYVGMALPGKVVHTIFGGYLTVRDGELSERGRQ